MESIRRYPALWQITTSKLGCIRAHYMSTDFALPSRRSASVLEWGPLDKKAQPEAPARKDHRCIPGAAGSRARAQEPGKGTRARLKAGARDLVTRVYLPLAIKRGRRSPSPSRGLRRRMFSASEQRGGATMITPAAKVADETRRLRRLLRSPTLIRQRTQITASGQKT